MREIKFRCWDTGINYMYYDTDGYNIYNENDNGLHSGYEDKYGVWHQNKLMQYTGLLDKNGVETYEGDIVNYLSIYGEDSNILVEFKDGGFYPFAPDYIHWSDVEVIGNIYENPELLEIK